MTSMEDNLNGRQTIWRTTSMEDDINGRQPQWKMTALACLTSQFCSELGPAQPQLVCLFNQNNTLQFYYNCCNIIIIAGIVFHLL